MLCSALRALSSSSKPDLEACNAVTVSSNLAVHALSSSSKPDLEACNAVTVSSNLAVHRSDPVPTNTMATAALAPQTLRDKNISDQGNEWVVLKKKKKKKK
ncbi:unnamed protein product [Zymoseptoria tritici ST99CH_1A5]|uniref:Uncharacterized protein n=1 Tax=Zymoseptoria tritici ST99CH_1A5 TaxID=1276529 RepID=A0A1Y6M1W5_ZYMTR|nr:unnamed protein product [Zymoseptoria tritici ST99CH_1A5]